MLKTEMRLMLEVANKVSSTHLQSALSGLKWDCFHSTNNTAEELKGLGSRFEWNNKQSGSTMEIENKCLQVIQHLNEEKALDAACCSRRFLDFVYTFQT